MTSDTPMHKFMCEIGEINNLIHDVLLSSRKSRWRWRSFYLMYVEVDRLTALLGQVPRLFEPPSHGIGEVSTVAENVEGANELFTMISARQKSIVDSLVQMSRTTSASPAAPEAHQRLCAHVHPKSGWYQTFMAAYCSGMLSADGQTLTRTIIPINAGQPYERLSHLDAECLIRHQSLDLTRPGSTVALTQAVEATRLSLGKTAAAMQTCLVENCTIHDLL